MKTFLFEVLKVILPTIIAGFFSFVITKYTCNKNRPLDKIEIAYNRIYYPIYKIISDKNVNNDIDKVINKSKIYFIKYDKYIDTSTKKIFDLLYKCNKKAKRKSIYQSFKYNINDKNSYLRRKLGYLEPNFIQDYKYSSTAYKFFTRISIETVLLYIFFILSYMIITYFNNDINKINGIYSIPLVLVFLLSIITIADILYSFIRYLYYKIKK